MNFNVNAEHLCSAIENGRRRVLYRRALYEGLLAVGILMSGVAVLLTVGTRLFPIWFLWLIGFGGASIALLRWYRNRPSRFVVARSIDKAWSSSDQISTAYYFLQKTRASEWVHQQRIRANRLARLGDIDTVFPYDVPGSAWMLGTTMLVTTFVFAVRVGIQDPFSLNDPLPFFSSEAPKQVIHELEVPRDSATIVPPADERLTASVETPEEIIPADFSDESDINLSDQAIDSVGENLGDPEVDGLVFDETIGDEMRSGDSPFLEQGEEGFSEEIAQEGDSLLEKLQDAFENMLASMNMESPQMGPSSDSSSEKKNNTETQMSGNGQEAAGSESAQEDGASSDHASSEEIGEQFSVEEGSNEGEQQQGESSVATAGTGEGSKEFISTEHDEKLGALTELFQQRAKEVKGDFTIESRSAQQKVRTPYSPSTNTHGDKGAVLSRDEIPIDYHTYVQRYFEMVRQKGTE